MKKFWICSYGGCGSWMIWRALEKYGKVVHCHYRKPLMEFPEDSDDENMENIIIYIYRDPAKAILSRFRNHLHLRNIEAPDENVTLQQVLEQNKDLYGIEEFYRNYTTKDENRKHKIVCVKFEDVFKNQERLSELLDVGPLNLENTEQKREKDKLYPFIYNVYRELITEMKNNDGIFIV
jgi:hypothetical protein